MRVLCIQKSRRARGTAMVMAVILSIVVTGIIMTLAYAAAIQSKSTSELTQVDAANFVAEAGSQRAAWYLKNNQSPTQPLTGSINGGSYSVTWSSIGTKTYRVTSVGTKGAAANTVLVTVKVPTVQAAFSVGGDITFKNLNIDGNVIVGGIADFQPGTAEVAGNLTYGNKVLGSADVSGTQLKTTWESLDWTTAQNSLAAASTSTGLPGSGLTFNFTNVTGTNKVITVTGDVTNPSFIGSGTLYVIGNVTLGNIDIGTSANPVHIIATGNITMTANITYYGALYCKGTLTRRKIYLYGAIYAESDIDSNTNGNSTMTFTTAPWFETRTTGGSAGSTQFMNFAGATP